MPQLDIIIIFSQVFWLIMVFFFTYTILNHFFLPLFLKSLKARKRIVTKNASLLLHTQEQFDLKQSQLSAVLNKNFCSVKSILEMEVNNLFSKKFLSDLSEIDAKLIKSLYYNTYYYDTSLLTTISLTPKFSNLRFVS